MLDIWVISFFVYFGKASEVECPSKALEQEFEDLSAELEKKLAKKEKYKEMYNAEKSANEQLSRELEEKQLEVDKLKARVIEIPNEWDYRLRALEVIYVVGDIASAYLESYHFMELEWNRAWCHRNSIEMEKILAGLSKGSTEQDCVNLD